METKQVMIQNKEEEREFLEEAERRGMVWDLSHLMPSKFIPSTNDWFKCFPYVITVEAMSSAALQSVSI